MAGAGTAAAAAVLFYERSLGQFPKRLVGCCPAVPATLPARRSGLHPVVQHLFVFLVPTTPNSILAARSGRAMFLHEKFGFDVQGLRCLVWRTVLI